MSRPEIQLRNHRFNRSDEDDGFVESILNSDEDRQESHLQNLPTDINRRKLTNSPDILPKSVVNNHRFSNSRTEFPHYSPDIQKSQREKEIWSKPLPTPDLLHPHNAEFTTTLAAQSVKDSFSSSFGDFLDVPGPAHAGFSSRSASPSTDEGIGPDDLLHDCLNNSHQNVEEMRNDEQYSLMGVPAVFCACCYNTRTGHIIKRSIPAARHTSSFFEEQRGPLLRIKSEEIPRTEPPNSIKWFKSNFEEDVEEQNEGQSHRQMFVNRGHSISDAKVPYRPISDEFNGIKQFKHRRKLPEVPKVTHLDTSTRAQSTRKFIYMNSEQQVMCPSEFSHKPPLRRQHRQCFDSNEELSENCLKSPNCSVRFKRNSIEKNSNQKDTSSCTEGSSCITVELSDTDLENNNYLQRSSLITKSIPKDSFVYLRANDNIPGTSLVLERAKSVDCPRKLPRALKVPSKSVDGENISIRKFTPVNDEIDRSISNYYHDEVSQHIENKTPSIESNMNDSEVIKDDKDDHMLSNETINKPTSADAQRSLAERLMAVAPTDQRRVQGIVQDVLFEMGKERILQYKSAFAKFDKDSSGIISSKQLRRLLRNLGHNPGDEELRELVNQVDMDENGKIDFNEFIIMIGYFDKANNTFEDLGHIFRVFDESHGGSINVSELRDICSEYLVESVPLEKINEMIDFVDRDGDGEINRDELCRVWSNRW